MTLTPLQKYLKEIKDLRRAYVAAQEAAKLALADNERVYQNTRHNALSYETREALRRVVGEGGNNG